MKPPSILDPGLQDHSRDHDTEQCKSTSRLFLDPEDYPGGIGFWGALPAVYDTSVFPPEDGVHVHARRTVGGEKEIDQTYEEVEIPLAEGRSFVINGRHGVAYNVATILRRHLTALICPQCQHVHCDEDFWAVHYHQTHQCENCGGMWDSGTPAISNPLMLLKQMVGDTQQHRKIIDPVERVFRSTQSRWSGGIQMWGSNPALLWTSPKYEEGGIHVHACTRPGKIGADETFGTVEVDGLRLDPEQVRHLMAQQALSDLKHSITSLTCPSCNTAHFDLFDLAVIPHQVHECDACGTIFSSAAAVVSNPVITQLEQLRKNLAIQNDSTNSSSCTQCHQQLSQAYS
ncbi:hypothetical protein [Prosthecobacter sp.]|uniref:hypothetical protein n=1 Tax=Prosthecobacter sp. TaxID=1965333 RepID=UPI003782FC0F